VALLAEGWPYSIVLILDTIEEISSRFFTYYRFSP